MIFIIALTPLWAKEMQDAKLDHIDAAMRLHGLPDAGGVQQHQEADGSPRVPQSGVQRAELHKGRTEDDRGTGVET